MRLIHCSHVGGIKSPPDILHKQDIDDGTDIMSYHRYHYLKGLPAPTEEEMLRNREDRVVFFSLPGWTLWPYGEMYSIEVDNNTPCYASIGGSYSSLTNIEVAEEVLLEVLERERLPLDNIRFFEVVIPIKWLPSDINIIYRYL